MTLRPISIVRHKTWGNASPITTLRNTTITLDHYRTVKRHQVVTAHAFLASHPTAITGRTTLPVWHHGSRVTILTFGQVTEGVSDSNLSIIWAQWELISDPDPVSYDEIACAILRYAEVDRIQHTMNNLKSHASETDEHTMQKVSVCCILQTTDVLEDDPCGF